MGKLKTISIHGTRRYSEDENLYTFQIEHRKRYNLWWLLLLLLPLLLLVKCNKDVTVHCTDDITGTDASDVRITMNYKAHYLWGSKGFLQTDTINVVNTTDSLGNAKFKDLPCSVYSYIIHCMDEARLNAKDGCHIDLNAKHNFHYNRNIELSLKSRLETLNVLIKDAETGDLLPDAVILYKYIKAGRERVDSVSANAAGIASMSGMPYCSVIKELTGRCYGYADSKMLDVPCQSILSASDSNAINLKPIKRRLTFFVKDRKTREPIPDARCNVRLTYPGKDGRIINRQVRTSIDGKGIAVYDSAFVLSKLEVSASKVNYKSNSLRNAPWVVYKFIKQNDNTRTIYLDNASVCRQLQNIDSITGRPVAGVQNDIELVSSDGSRITLNEISNNNGMFSISASGSEQVYITSEKSQEYKPKHTFIGSYKDINGYNNKISMSPIMDTLTFRTVSAESRGKLVPDCNLQVRGSLSGSMGPYNSGNGIFDVSMRKYETLSIYASKDGFKYNSSAVNNRGWLYLSADAGRRDIPMMSDVPPCSGGVNRPKAKNEKRHVCSYGMGMETGESHISGDFYGIYDLLTVYDGPDTTYPVLIGPGKKLTNKFKIPFKFTHGVVTVVIETSKEYASMWEYILHCPDK